MKRVRKAFPADDERDEALGQALRQAAASYAGEGFRLPEARRAKRLTLPLAAAAAVLALAGAYSGFALSNRGSLRRSAADFTAWLLPERSSWLIEAQGLEAMDSDPTLDFIERLWEDI
jgi:hypothetical protein